MVTEVMEAAECGMLVHEPEIAVNNLVLLDLVIVSERELRSGNGGWMKGLAVDYVASRCSNTDRHKLVMQDPRGHSMASSMCGVEFDGPGRRFCLVMSAGGRSDRGPWRCALLGIISSISSAKGRHHVCCC